MTVNVISARFVKPMENQTGYTLIETLIVLSIVMICMHFFLMIPKSEPTEEDLHAFLEMFEEDIFYLQQYTMTHKIMPQLYLSPTDHSYRIIHPTLSDALIKRSYNRHLHIQLNSFNNPLRFNTDGTIIAPGSFHINFNDKKYKIVFRFGKGRFRIEEIHPAD